MPHLLTAVPNAGVNPNGLSNPVYLSRGSLPPNPGTSTWSDTSVEFGCIAAGTVQIDIATDTTTLALGLPAGTSFGVATANGLTFDATATIVTLAIGGGSVVFTANAAATADALFDYAIFQAL